MMKTYLKQLSLIAVCLFLLGLAGCQYHNEEDLFGHSGGGNCDPAIVYFERDVLPILRSSCAIQGCHDAQSAKAKVMLTDYASVISTAKVKAGDPDDSELYEVLIESDPDNRMPPPPHSPLNSEQIEKIQTWIIQGAKDQHCDPGGNCTTDAVSFSQTIFPIIQNTCTGCHSGTSPRGGIRLQNHAEIAAVAATGSLYGSIAWQSGFSRMPKNGSQLGPCYQDQVKAWIDQGAKNN